jgi:hypothetical protein
LCHPNFAEHTNIIVLICLIVALLAFPDLHADSPPSLEKSGENHADYMPIIIIYNILISCNNLEVTLYIRDIVTIIVRRLAIRAGTRGDALWHTGSLPNKYSVRVAESQP